MNKKSVDFNAHFLDIARKSSEVVGAPWFFLSAVLALIAWAIVGLFNNHSGAWHLVLPTSITVLTFLIVILLQSAQNRELKGLQLKLDELIKSSKRARDSLINLQELSEEELETIRKDFERLQKEGETRSEEEKKLSAS